MISLLLLCIFPLLVVFFVLCLLKKNVACLIFSAILALFYIGCGVASFFVTAPKEMDKIASIVCGAIWIFITVTSYKAWMLDKQIIAMLAKHDALEEEIKNLEDALNIEHSGE